MSYNTKNYAAHGGNEWVVGGKLTILDGATVTGIAATAEAASAEALGGVKAVAKGEQDTIEVKIGTDSKLYVPAYPETYTLPGAAADTLGGVTLAANQADSTASTVAGLKDDLNALLAKLKVSGVMAADEPAE
jgi:hypothetical protein